MKEHIDYITPGIKLMGYGNTQQPPLKKRGEAGSGNLPRFGQRVSESELAHVMSERSRRNLPSKRTTGPNVEGPLRFAEPVETAHIESGNFTLPGGCDEYVTPDCIRSKSARLDCRV